VPRGEVIGNPVGYDLCVSAELSRCRIELLRHQLAATCEQHKAAGVDRVGQRAEQGTVLRAIERGEVHGVILGLDGIVIDGDIKKVLTIRKKEGPAMRSVPGPINFRSRDRGPAIGADSHNGRLCVCGQEDHAVRSPGASASLRGVANHARRATVKVDGFELPIGEEGERPAIWRPEGKCHVVGTWQSAPFKLVHGTTTQHDLAVRRSGRKRDVGTIGREHRGTGQVAGQPERGALRGSNDGADGASGLTETVDENPSNCTGDNRDEDGRCPDETLTGMARGWRQSWRWTATIGLRQSI